MVVRGGREERAVVFNRHGVQFGTMKSTLGLVVQHCECAGATALYAWKWLRW